MIWNGLQLYLISMYSFQNQLVICYLCPSMKILFSFSCNKIYQWYSLELCCDLYLHLFPLSLLILLLKQLTFVRKWCPAVHVEGFLLTVPIKICFLIMLFGLAGVPPLLFLKKGFLGPFIICGAFSKKALASFLRESPNTCVSNGMDFWHMFL